MYLYADFGDLNQVQTPIVNHYFLQISTLTLTSNCECWKTIIPRKVKFNYTLGWTH